MPSLLSLVSTAVVAALSTFLTKFLTALGLSIVTYAALSAVVTRLLDLVAPYLKGLPADVLALMAIAGVGQGLTIVASALVSRAAILSAKATFAVSK